MRKSRTTVRPAIRRIKRLMPANLFGRTLLIVLLPIVLLQLVTAHIFYERHWESVARNMSVSAAADIDVLVQEYQRIRANASDNAALQHARVLGETMAIDVAFVSVTVVDGHGAGAFPSFYRDLDRRINAPFMVEALRDERFIRVSVDLGDHVLQYTLSAKRLASATTFIFILWMMGSAALLVMIAGLFLRNQIRPMVQLARAAEQFGLGQDVQNFVPRGASEVRRAGRAFLIMADRIRRQVASRTEMLAGISHDLRTPLTRMQLEIEMGKIDAATRGALVGEIEEMRKMIDEYLDFARGDAAEPMEEIDMVALVRTLVEQYKRQAADIAFVSGQQMEALLHLRPQAIRRALTNLIDNALRYGSCARISVEQTIGFVYVKVRDTGPGIPVTDHETVFKPFTRLEPSRNLATGGVGLGLSIARDIAQNHGGEISLENRKDASGRITGLEVTLRLPREVQAVVE